MPGSSLATLNVLFIYTVPEASGPVRYSGEEFGFAFAYEGVEDMKYC